MLVVIRIMCLDLQRNCFVFGRSVCLVLTYEASLELGINRFLSHTFIGPEKRMILKVNVKEMCCEYVPCIHLPENRADCKSAGKSAV